MPSGKGPAGDESRPTNGVHGGTTKGSAAVKKLLKEINGLPSEDKKELSASLMGLALIEEEKLEKEKSLRTTSKTGKPRESVGGQDRRRLLLQLEHPQVQTRVLKFHPEVTVVGMSAYQSYQYRWLRRSEQPRGGCPAVGHRYLDLLTRPR